MRPMPFLERGVIGGSFCYLLASAYFLYWGSADLLPSLLLAFVIFGTSCGLLYFAAWSEFWSNRIFIALSAIILLCCQILEYAIVYRKEGLVGGSGIVTKDPTNCLYFSIITWTTVGYGDFVPTIQTRLWAASEALVGYFSMIVLISIVVAVIRYPDASDP